MNENEQSIVSQPAVDQPVVLPAPPASPEPPQLARPRRRGVIIGAAVLVLAVVGGAAAYYKATRVPAQQASSQQPSSPGQPSVPAAAVRPAVKYLKQTIKDPAAGNVDAFSFLAPEGWRGQGNVEWMHQWERLVQLHTTVTDPATGTTVEWLPIQDFMWFQAPAGFSAPVGGNYQGKAYVPPITDPAQFVTEFWAPNALARLQGATLVRTTDVPEIANEFIRLFGGPGEAHAYRLRYEYNQNGTPWEEDVQFALLFSSSNGITSWYVNYATSVRAPKGELDEQQGVASTVIASRATTVEWEATYRQVQKLFIQGIIQQMNDTVAFGQALQQYRAESQALQQQVVNERAASQDHNAELFRQTLGGVESYNDPVNGGLVELPLGWNQYWVNQKGEYITSDNVNFDPNTLNDGTWQLLQKTNP